MLPDALDRRLRSLAYQALVFRDHGRRLHPPRRDFARWARLDAAAIQDRHQALLQDLLVHAGATAPYYRDLFAAHGFDPRAPSAAEDLPRLPPVTKALLARHKEAMRSRRYRPAELVTSFTGGSSGSPASFYQDRACSLQRLGRQWGILETCGYLPGDRCGLIWGVHSDLPDPSRPPGLKARLRRYATARENLCCTVMSRVDLHDFHGRLRRFQPSVLYGYPNAMEEFARFIQAQNLPPVTVETVICTAERLTERQRSLFHQRFGGEVFNLYCTREHGCIGFECRAHRGLHLDAGSVHIEILAGDRPAAPGEAGDIVVTDLLNYGMPFIRSKIGDRGRLAPAPCPCGCGLPLLEAFEGRVTDTLYRTDGSTVAGLMLVDLFLDDPVIENLQVIQDRIGEVEVHLEVHDGYGADDDRRVQDMFRSYLGEGTSIRIARTAKIPRNPQSGKFQEVICRVPAGRS